MVTTTPDLIPIPLMREILKEHSMRGLPVAPLAFGALAWAGVTCAGIVWVRLADVNPVLVLAASGAGLLLGAVAYFGVRWHTGFDAETRFRKAILREYGRLLAKMRTAGFEAAADGVEGIVRETIAFAQHRPTLFAVFDEALRFFLSKFVGVMVVTEVPRDYQLALRDLRLVEKRMLQRPTENPQTDRVIHSELAHIQIRLNRLERAIQAGLQLTSEIQGIRDLCRATAQEDLSGEAELRRAEELVRMFNERGTRLEEELQRWGF